jgi:hypothetical protein
VKKVLVELVGEQPTPNLIPALENRPDEVIFVVSDRTEPCARNTRAALEMAPALSQARFSMVKVDPYNISAASDAVERALEKRPGANFVFNITGGTKPMMVGLYRVASSARWRERARMVYVSTELETEQTIVGDAFEERSLALEIPAVVYLRAHGVTTTGQPVSVPKPWGKIAFELAQQIETEARERLRNRTINQMLARVHRAAEGIKSEQFRGSPIRIPRKSVRTVGLNLLRHCQEAGVLRGLKLAGGEIEFELDGAQALAFLKGQWLEVFTAETARHTEVFHDVMMHVPIDHPQLGRREIDVVAMRGVVAVICSCKASRIPRGTARNLPLDELEARSRALGRYCGKVFVTSRTGYTDTVVKKVAGMGIHVVRPQALTTVGDVLVEASRSKGQLIG